jgi:exonuclease III/ribonuclease HI
VQPPWGPPQPHLTHSYGPVPPPLANAHDATMAEAPGSSKSTRVSMLPRLPLALKKLDLVTQADTHHQSFNHLMFTIHRKAKNWSQVETPKQEQAEDQGNDTTLSYTEASFVVAKSSGGVKFRTLLVPFLKNIVLYYKGAKCCNGYVAVSINGDCDAAISFLPANGFALRLELDIKECTNLQLEFQQEVPHAKNEPKRINHGNNTSTDKHSNHSQHGTQRNASGQILTSYTILLTLHNVEVEERELCNSRSRHVRRRQQWPSWQITKHLQIFNRGTSLASITEYPMSEALIKLLQLMGGIEPNPGPMYHEKQDRSYCLVHAINNAIGKQILTGKDLCTFLTSMQRIRPDITEHFHSRDGDFTDTAINIWLWTHLTSPHMISRRQMERRKETNRTWSLEAIEHVLDNMWDSALIQHNDHWTAIKKYQGSWYLLDSLKEAPVRLDETHCRQVHGALLTIEEIDAQEHGLLEHPTREQPYLTSYAQIPDTMTPYHKDKFHPQQHPVRYLPKHKDIPLIRPYPSDRIHHEKQESKFCAIHALNALFGRAITNGKDVCRYMDKLKSQHTAFPITNLYTPEEGNFATGAINLWLRAHTSPKVALVSISDTGASINEQNWTLDKMEKTMNHKWDRIMIVNPMVHWVTIRKERKDYLLVDSMQNKVLNLTINPEHWRKVKGIPVALQARDTMSYQDTWYVCDPVWLDANPPTPAEQPIHPHGVNLNTSISLPLPPWHNNGMAGADTHRPLQPGSNTEGSSPPLRPSRRPIPHEKSNNQEPTPQTRRIPLRQTKGIDKPSPPPKSPRRPISCSKTNPKPAPKTKPIRISNKPIVKHYTYAKLRNNILKATASNTSLDKPNASGKQRAKKKESCKQNPITSFFVLKHSQNPAGKETTETTNLTQATTPNCIPASGTSLKTSRDLRQDATRPIANSSGTGNKQQEPMTCPKMTILTLNVRGIRTGQVDTWEIVSKQAPDVVILTETHMHSKQKRNYYLHNECFSGYNLITSCDDEMTRGSGVLIAMKTRLHKQGNIEILKEYEYKGYLLPIKITLPYSETLILVGTYLPNPDTTGTTQESTRRDRAMSCMQKLLEYTRTTKQQIIVAGDMNAVLQERDRQERNLNRSDIEWQQLTEKHNLTSLPAKMDCLDFTFRKAFSADATSRIDDILYAGRYIGNNIIHHAEVINTVGALLDHNALHIALNINNMNIIAPSDPPPQARDTKMLLERPIKPEHQKTFRATVAAQLHDSISHFNSELHETLAYEVFPHMQTLDTCNGDGPSRRLTEISGIPASEWVEKTSKTLIEMLLKTQSIAMTVCPTRTQHTGRFFMRPRAISRDRATLKSKKITLMRARTAIRFRTVGMTNSQAEESVGRVSTLTDETKHIIETHLGKLELEANAYKTIMHANKVLNTEIHDIDTKFAKISTQLAHERLRKLADLSPKIGNKMMTGSSTNRQPLEALEDPITKRATTDTKRILEIIEEYQEPYLQPPKTPKHGLYLPQSRPNPLYPWDEPAAPDNFKLESHSTNKKDRPWLHNRIFCYTTFTSVLNSISTGKSPGPDTITNDLLKMLPNEFKKGIHRLMCILYATGITPEHWGESETALIYKGKNSPLTLDNYRPIGLVNTIGKLWTRFLTCVLSSFAESNGILGLHNAGFRRGKSTTRQILLTINALEDARLTGQNIYLMQIDLTQAFNRIDHDLLLATMYDLGFPTCSIDAVSGVYKNVKTCYKAETGKTQPMQINRGTLQGDSLSPFIFLIYIEPLLRWLHVGGRGYKFGCLPQDERAKNHTSNITFADDLNVLTNKAADLRIQADKVSRWCNWASMTVNNSKSLVTGILHSTTNTKHPGCKGPTDEQAIENQLRDIYIQGKPIASMAPKSPFKFLGLTLTMTLDWKPQRTEIINKIRNKISHLITNAFATPNQKRRAIQTCIRPMILYGMEAAPYNDATLTILDGLLAKATKKSYGVMTCASTAMTHSDILHFGMACPSIKVEYNQKCTAALVEASNDTSRDGIITRALLNKHIENMHRLELRQKAGEYPYAMTLRQLSCAHHSSVAISLKGEEQYVMDTCTLVDQIKHLRYDVYCLGLLTDLPKSILPTMAELGITEIEQLLDKTCKDPTIIPASHLQMKFGKILTRHCRALNAITTALHQEYPIGPYEYKEMTKEDLPLSARKIHHSHISHIQIPNDTLITTYFPTITREDTGILIEHTKETEMILEMNTNDIIDTEIVTPQPEHDMPLPEALDENNHIVAGRRNTKRACNEKTHSSPATKDTNKEPQQAKITRKKKRPSTAPDDNPRRTILEPIQYTELEAPSNHNRKIRAATLARVGNPYKAMQMLHGEHDKPTNITELIIARTPYTTSKRKHKKKQLVQNKYKVQWHYSIIPDWELKYYENTRYAPIQVIPIDKDDPEWKQYILCEHCDKNTSNLENPLMICRTCEKGYHHLCVQATNSLEENYKCKQCREHESIGMPPDTNRWIRVEWPDTYEPQDNLIDQGHSDLIANFMKHNRFDNSQAFSACNKRQDEHLTNLERQGVYTAPPTEAETHAAVTLKTKVHISTTTIQPHTDIHPTHSPSIQLREVEGMTEQGEYYNVPLACVYHTDGTCAGTMRPERMEQLRLNYNGEHHLFPDEVIKLLKRHTTGYKENKHAAPYNTKHDWAPPTHIVQTIQTQFQAYTDRITTPLKSDKNMTTHYTNFIDDTKFGAQHGSYNHPWLGSSFAVPQQSPEEMHKAVRWAYHSASGSDEPTLTTLLLCSGETDSTSYMKWLRQYPMECHLLTTIPAKNFPIIGHDHWQGPSDQPKNLKHDINVIMIGNLGGYKAYATKTEHDWKQLSKDLHHGINSSYSVPKCTTSHEQEPTQQPFNNNRDIIPPIMLSCPKILQLLLHTHKNTSRNTTKASIHQGKEANLQIYTKTAPLRYNWRSMTYTDGSRVEVPGSTEQSKTLGSGVFIPDAENIKVPCAGTQIAIDPEGKGITNTIVRAELAPILHSLRLGRNNIATDSLTSLQLISKFIAAPWCLTTHTHYLLLQDIQDALIAHPQNVSLHKIQSHSRNIGNIKADQIAKQARHANTDGSDKIHIPDGNSPHANLYWPQAKLTNPETGRTESKEFNSLHTPLKKHMHEHHHMGNSNIQSSYFKYWKGILPTVNKVATNHFMTHATDSGKKILLNYRCGTLLTNKWRHRMNPLHTNMCPLCEETTDGGHHALSGCRIVAQKIGSLRHNAAGRKIIKAISVGNKGADLIMADVGRKSLMEEAGICGLSHRIPNWILQDPMDNDTYHPMQEWEDTSSTATTGTQPSQTKTTPDTNDTHEFYEDTQAMEQEQEDENVTRMRDDIKKTTTSLNNRLVPDGFLLSNGRKSNMTSNTEFTIMEIKYCMDTKPEGQEHNGTKQHVELCKRLSKKWACKVTLHTILLGVGGTIYTKMEETMRNLGVAGAAYTKLANDLNLIAADFAQQAMALRMAMCPSIQHQQHKKLKNILRGSDKQTTSQKRASGTCLDHKTHKRSRTTYQNPQPNTRKLQTSYKDPH